MKMEDLDEDLEMDMPTPCYECNQLFDLNDGYESEKWHPGVIICKKCHIEEEKEIEIDTELEELIDSVEDARHTIKDGRDRIASIKGVTSDASIMEEGGKILQALGIIPVGEVDPNISKAFMQGYLFAINPKNRMI